MLSIWTDGSCIGNPGFGGWAFVTDTHSDYGSEPQTTNNRMELQAIIEALRWSGKAHKGEAVKIFSDSQLSINVLTCAWRASKNLDLIGEAWRLTSDRLIEYQWVRGHSTSPQNNTADALAYQAASWEAEQAEFDQPGGPADYQAMMSHMRGI